MRIVLTGSTGFLGRHLRAQLQTRGHDLVCPVRNVPQERAHEHIRYVTIDYQMATHPASWRDIVASADVVINAVGILRESPSQSFDNVHRAAPAALFQAAQDAGVTRAIQISALGADEQAQSAYHKSKKAGDDALRSLSINYAIVQPSLIYGAGGTSATLFSTFASLPVIPLPGKGLQQIQPIHIDDVTAALVALVEQKGVAPQELALVGPYPIALRNFYLSLRQKMGIRARPVFLPIPGPLMAITSRLAERLPGSLLSADTLAMLERGNVASSKGVRQVLGRLPLAPDQFISHRYSRAVGTQAKLRWLLPVLRWSIGLVWIVTGVISMGIYPLDASYALLARSGVPAGLMPLALFAAAITDIVLGILTMLTRRPRWVWPLQAAIVLVYMVIITIRLPEFWLHPYGPILKNLPFLAALWLLYELEDKAWNTS